MWKSDDLPDCVCSGDVLTYECTVVGSGSTVWEGSAFQCSGINNNFILLRHSQFSSPEKPRGVCNNGRIVARAIEVVDNNYISQLNVTVSPVTNNKTVKCVHDNPSSATTVGTTTVTIAGGSNICTLACCFSDICVVDSWSCIYTRTTN